MNSPESYRSRNRSATIAVATGLMLALAACSNQSDAKPLSHPSSPDATTTAKGICGIAQDGTVKGESGRQTLARAESAVKILEERGLSKPAASAVVATMLRESCINPDSYVPGDKSGMMGHGVLMWSKPGQDRLEQYAAKNQANPSVLATQVAFTVDDLRTLYPETYTDLRKATDVTSAASVFISDYLKPSDTDRTVQGVVRYANMLDGVASR